MHQGVELAVALPELGEELGDFFVARNVAAKGLGAGEFGDQRLRVFFEPLVLVGDGELGAGLLELLRDSPGDAALVGQAEDDSRASVNAAHGCLPPRANGQDNKAIW